MSPIYILAQATGTPAATSPAPSQPAASTPPPSGQTTTQPADNKPADNAAPAAGIFNNGFVMMALIAVIFYMLLIRPQRKAQKEQQARINALQPGDKIITNAGLHGSIRKVGDTSVDVEIAPGVVVTIEKAAVVNVLK